MTQMMTQTDSMVWEMLSKAGLDWEVECQDLVLASDTQTCDSLEECRKVPARAVVRKDTGRPLGVVGMEYQTAQNWQQLAPLAYLAQLGGTDVQAGSSKGGARIWAHVDIKVRGEVVKGDVIAHRIMLASSHDGSMSLKIQDCLVRLLCTNGMTGTEMGAYVNIRHTVGLKDRLEQMAGILASAQVRFGSTMAEYRALAGRRMGVQETGDYIRNVFATPKQLAANEGAGERVAQRVIELVETGRGSNTYGVRGTAWGAYNAVTQYLTHDRGTDSDRRWDSLWFGNGAALNKRALDLALALTR